MRPLLALTLCLLAAPAHAGLYVGCTNCVPMSTASMAYPAMHAATLYAQPAMAAYAQPTYSMSYAAPAPLYAAPLYAAPMYAQPQAQAVQPIHFTLTAPVTPVPQRAAATAPDAGSNLDAAITRMTKQMESLARIVEQHTSTLKDHEVRIQAAEAATGKPKLTIPMPPASH